VTPQTIRNSSPCTPATVLLPLAEEQSIVDLLARPSWSDSSREPIPEENPEEPGDQEAAAADAYKSEDDHDFVPEDYE